MVKPTKSLTCFDKDKNLNKIKQLSFGLQKLQGSSINLKTGFPWKSSSENYLEDVTSRAYKTTLRVNSINIENNVPKNMLEKLWTYQKKHDKLLELFYSMLPIKEENKESFEKVLAVEGIIRSLGKEISDLIKQMNKDNEFKKFSSILEPMKTTLIKAVNNFKETKDKFSKVKV